MIPESLSPIANHLWQSTLFAGIAGLLTLALRKNSALVRHWVWVAASLKFLIPFSVLVAIGSRIEWRMTPSIAPNLSVVMQQVSQPFTITAVSSPALTTTPMAANLLPEILLAIWACGFIGKACSWWIHWRRIRATVRAGSSVPLDISIRAISSPSFMEPGVFGVFRPVLLVPEGILDHLTPDQWKSVVAHELCHVRHRDNIIAVVQMFVETVFWFHPLVWWIGKRMFQERERACDEEVLRLGNQPRAYAQGILKVCELYLESPVACVAGVSGSNLTKRIEGIMSNCIVERLTSGKKLFLAGAGMVALTVPLVVGLMNARPLRAQSQTAREVSQAQNLAGIWQGSLNAGGGELRIAFKISLEDDRLTAIMYTIDEGGQAIPATVITPDGSTIRIAVGDIAGYYDGKLSSDGRSIVGTWTRGTPIPLNLTHVTPQTAWAIPDAPPLPKLMSTDASPVFEVATIKPSKSGQPVSIRVNPSGLVNTTATSLGHLIRFAYDLQPRQLIGGPPWLETQNYDVTAKPDKPGMPSGVQLKAMVQKLLADRFQLALHRDKRELSAYAIIVAKPGAKLVENHSDPNGQYSFSVTSERLQGGRLTIRNGTMAEFASVLQANILDRPAVDETGLGTARYDLILSWTPDGSRSDDPDAPPDLFAAFQQQLGLKLESAKASVDVLVIDHVERPSEN